MVHPLDDDLTLAVHPRLRNRRSLPHAAGTLAGAKAKTKAKPKTKTKPKTKAKLKRATASARNRRAIAAWPILQAFARLVRFGKSRYMDQTATLGRREWNAPLRKT
jgi:hypothetical protein